MSSAGLKRLRVSGFNFKFDLFFRLLKQVDTEEILRELKLREESSFIIHFNLC